MNSYYLGLDLNLPQNIKILKVKKELGYSGFGLYVEILLKLAQSPNYELSITDYELLAYEFRLDTKYIKSLIENYDLFTIENFKFYCEEVKQKMFNLERKKEAGKKAGKASGEARKKIKTNSRSTVVQTVVEQGDIIKKENIINKSKVNKNIYVGEAKEVLEFFNQTFNKTLKSTVSWEENFCYWREIYNLEEIKKAIGNLQNPKWFAKNEPSLELLFRTKNKNGKCDYIQNLLEFSKIEIVVPKLEEPDSFDVMMQRFTQKQI